MIGGEGGGHTCTRNVNRGHEDTGDVQRESERERERERERENARLRAGISVWLASRSLLPRAEVFRRKLLLVHRGSGWMRFLIGVIYPTTVGLRVENIRRDSILCTRERVHVIA